MSTDNRVAQQSMPVPNAVQVTSIGRSKTKSAKNITSSLRQPHPDAAATSMGDTTYVMATMAATTTANDVTMAGSYC